MTDPVREDGGGLDAASALAFQLVNQASPGQELGRRLRQSLGSDTDECAALKLGVKVSALRRACKSGKTDSTLLRMVCLAYGANGDWLLTGRGTMRPPEPDTASDDETPALDALEELEDRLSRLQRIVDSARALRENDSTSTKNPDGHDWL